MGGRVAGCGCLMESCSGWWIWMADECGIGVVGLS